MAIKLHDGSFSFGVTDISKMETTQTAVEWLAEELKSKGHALITTEGVFINVPNELLEQAKKMEKEQKEKACMEVAEIAKEILRKELKDFIVLPKP